ncbi:MAG: hypothetical protein ACRDK7_01120, partial [Solirubrobacteraceae bacterium]
CGSSATERPRGAGAGGGRARTMAPIEKGLSMRLEMRRTSTAEVGCGIAPDPVLADLLGLKAGEQPCAPGEGIS